MPIQKWLKVTPNELSKKASEIKLEIDGIEEQFQILGNVVAGTSRYWFGKGGERHRQSYVAFNQSAEEMMYEIKDQPQKLLDIAGVYETTELKIVEVEKVLPTNILE